MLRKYTLPLFLICLGFLPLKAQNFEGWITYKTEAVNPHPDKMPDSVWMAGVKEQFGEKGYIIQKYFYSEGNYFSEIGEGENKGYQLFNRENKFIYSWKQGSDTASSVNSRKNSDKIIEIIALKKRQEILGIQCQGLLIKSKSEGLTLWYNQDYFKMDPKLFKSHDYRFWNKILKEIGCLPLKMELEGMMVHIVQTATSYKETSIPKETFTIPSFKVIMENPAN